MSRANRSEICQRAMDLAGGPTVIAGALGITTISVHMWRKVPLERIARISQMSGLPEEDLMLDWVRQHGADDKKDAVITKGSNQ